MPVGYDPAARRVYEIASRAKDWVKSLPSELYAKIISHLNEMEAWSMYFTNGVADHKIAFGPCAPVFCSHVLQHCAALIVSRNNPRSGKYPNVVGLFQTWRHQLEVEKNGLEMKEILSRIAELQNLKGPHKTLPSPLGTKLD